MAQPIGTAGLSRVTADTDTVKKLSFPLAASTTKQTGCKRGNYSLYFSVAGATDVSYQVTRDSLESISKGTAKWTNPTALANQALGDYYVGDLLGISGVRVTAAKNGAGTDDAPKLAVLGTRCQVRIVPTDEPNLNNVAPGSDYTGTFGDNPKEDDA